MTQELRGSEFGDVDAATAAGTAGGESDIGDMCSDDESTAGDALAEVDGGLAAGSSAAAPESATAVAAIASAASPSSVAATPTPKRRRRSPSLPGERVPVTPIADESHVLFWWFQFVLNGPLGVLLRALVHVSRPWRVLSGCTGQLSEIWAFQASRNYLQSFLLYNQIRVETGYYKFLSE